MKLNHSLLLVSLTTLISACSSVPDKKDVETPAVEKKTDSVITDPNNDPNAGRYSLEHDIAPKNPPSVTHIEAPTPRYENYSRGGNRDYTLRGKRYHIIDDPKGFTEKGIASWYGSKFHGHQTSNGEVYDMYAMSAAHKTLPIPSYVRVTNTDNGKQTIVRINDRGPFHEGRIIDLSYAAAYKLGVIQTGTAHVEISVITSDPKPHEIAKPDAFVVQISTFASAQKSQDLAQSVAKTLDVASFVEDSKLGHRVLLGPFNDHTMTQSTLEKAKMLGYSSAYIKNFTVTEPKK